MFKKRFWRRTARLLGLGILLITLASVCLYKAGMLSFNEHLEKEFPVWQACQEKLGDNIEIPLSLPLFDSLTNAIESLEKVEEECRRIPLYYVMLTDFYLLKGNDLSINLKTRLAIAYYYKALETSRKITNYYPYKKQTTANINNLLQGVYQTDGDLLKAEEFCQAALEQYEALGNNKWIGMGRMNLSRIYYLLGKYKESFRVSTAACEAFEATEMDHVDSTFYVAAWRSRAVSSIYLADQAARERDTSTMLQYQQAAIVATDAILARKDWFSPSEQTYQWPLLLQSITSHQLENPLILNLYKTAYLLEETESGLKKLERPDTSNLLALHESLKAEYLLHQGCAEEAEELLTNAWTRIGHSIDKNWNLHLDESQIALNITAYYSYFRSLNYLISPQESQKLFAAQMSVLRQINRPEFETQADYRTLAATNATINIYRECLQTAITLLPTNPSFIDSIQYLIEYQKARTLHHSIHANALDTEVEGEVKLWLDKKRAIREELLELQAKLSRTTDTALSDKINTSINALLSERQKFYRELASSESEKTQTLLQLSKPSVISVKEVQNAMPADEALIQFVDNEQNMLVISITNNTVSIHPTRPYVEWAAALEEYKGAFHENRDDPQTFIAAAHKMYQACLEEALSSLPTKIDKLTFILDRPLREVNLEACVRTLGGGNYFQDRDYLLEDYEIKYDYLLSSYYLNLQAESTEQAGLLVCAPEYQTHGGESCEQVANIDKLRALAYELGQQSNATMLPTTKQHLAEQTKGAKSLFFVVHGEANERDPLLSYLLLSPNEEQDCYLRLGELMCWKLDKADVVLGSCQTEMGPDIAGNGITSLAQALTIAGARSLVANIGNVKDEMTAHLLHSYFQYLEQGYDKSKALQKAKLDYLETAPARLTAPYCWAKTILIGHGGPAYPSVVQ